MIQLLTVFGNTKLFQNEAQGAELGKAELKEIEADKSGKKKPVSAVEKWTRLNP